MNEVILSENRSKLDDRYVKKIYFDEAKKKELARLEHEKVNKLKIEAELSGKRAALIQHEGIGKYYGGKLLSGVKTAVKGVSSDIKSFNSKSRTRRKFDDDYEYIEPRKRNKRYKNYNYIKHEKEERLTQPHMFLRLATEGKEKIHSESNPLYSGNPYWDTPNPYFNRRR